MNTIVGYKACYNLVKDGRCRMPKYHDGDCVGVWDDNDVKSVILYRRGVDPDADDLELEHANKYFPVVFQRTDVPEGSLVIGRMSVLPFYKELELDLANKNAKLVNTYRQHQFIADMREWCQALGDMTPKLYERLQDLPEEGPFVLKGQTNSKKHLWNTHMFAKNKREAGEVWSRLRDDMLLADQEIYARDYVPLVKLGEGLNGLPITKEFRFFIHGSRILCGSFYWASHVQDLKDVPNADEVPRKFLYEAMNRIGPNASFYTLDVAQTEKGDWIVIEINDGGMSGLSCNDPYQLYLNLRKSIYGMCTGCLANVFMHKEHQLCQGCGARVPVTLETRAFTNGTLCDKCDASIVLT